MKTDQNVLIINIAQVIGWIAVLIIVTSGDPDIIEGVVHWLTKL